MPMQETPPTSQITPLEMPWLTPDVLPAGQSFWQILKAAFGQYFKNGWTLTQPLLSPLLKITLGGYACIILNYLFIDWIVTLPGASIGLTLFGLLAITALTLWAFFAGFWQYIVYFASLNRNAAEAFAGRPIQVKEAYQTFLANNGGAYQMLLLAYIGAPLLVTILLSALSGILIVSNPAQDPFSLAASGLAAIILQLIGVMISAAVAILFTFVFQIAAFAKLPLNPLPALWRSIQLVSRRWPSVVALQLILAVLTTLLLPLLFSTVLRILWISRPLDWLHLWLAQMVLEGAAPAKDTAALLPPVYGEAFQMLSGNMSLMASAFTDTLIGMLLTALLLPLGTLVFTRLYWELRLKEE